MRHLVAMVDRDVVVVAPLVDAHLLRRDMHFRQRTLLDVLTGQHLVDRQRGVVAVRDRPDDVLRAERRVAAEEHFRIGRGESGLIDLRHVPLVELDAAVALDPGEGVFLAHRDQHVVAFDGLVRLARGHQVAAALGVEFGLHLLESDAGELAVIVREGDRHHVVEDRNVFVEGVFLFPGRRLHFLEAGTDDYLDLFATEAAGGAAAIHRGVAAAEYDDALADLLDMAERYRRQPFDADKDVGAGFLAAGNVEFAAARRAGADEDGVVIFTEQLLQAVDAVSALELDAEVEDVIGFLVDHLVRQPEFRNLATHHTAGLRIRIEHGAVIAERREVASDGERGGTAADQRDALAVLCQRRRHPMLDVVLEVGSDALEAADCNRRFLDAAPAARGLARTIAGASQDPGKHIRFPIDHIGVAITPLCNQPNVFGNWRVRGAGPLAIDHFMKVVRRRDVSRFHSYLIRAKIVETRPYFACERSVGVLVVFELDHRLILSKPLLEPFKSRYKGNFARSSAFKRCRMRERQ